jgi:TolB-like protein/class 3 adenylate cyclase
MEERLPRKLVAILYADVAEYSRLTGENEDATHRTLSAYLDHIASTIERHGGRVMHYAGDAVLAMFEAVVDALSCAAEVQSDLKIRNADLPDERRVQFRIGVNIGDVIEDRDDIYGDGVNVAARLESLADPGGICISEAVRGAVGNKLSFAYDSLGEQRVKNIAEPVRAYQVLIEPGATATTALRVPNRKIAALAAAGIGLAAIAGIAFWQLYSHVPSSQVERTAPTPAAVPLPESPSIAVLPFVNLSDDTKQEYFVDGLTEDLITDLAKLSSLFVISRNSVFTYKNQVVKLREVARDLGVRYVLEGSVRRVANRIRVNAQLIDATTDGHLWAERYDRVLDDVFEVQDEVKQQIVAALALELDAGEVEKLSRKPTENLEAYEYYLRGRRALDLGTRRNIRLAYLALEKAIELDPVFAEAYATLALNYAIDYGGTHYWDDWVRPPAKSRSQALKLVSQAAALDPDMALPELALAQMNLADRKFDEALVNANRAVKLQPGDSRVYEAQATVLTATGRHEEALQSMKQALRLDPKPPHHYYGTLGKIQFALYRYEEAVGNLVKATEGEIAGYTWRNSYYLPATYGYLDLVDNARAYIALSTHSIGFNLEHVRLHPIYEQGADIEHFLEGLRRAGVHRYIDGFDPKSDAGEPVDGATLRNWLAGSSFSAIKPSGQSRELTLRGGDTVTLQYRPNLSESGSASVQAGELCFRFVILTRGRTACYLVFHNTARVRTDLARYDYVMAGDQVWYLSRR